MQPVNIQYKSAALFFAVVKLGSPNCKTKTGQNYKIVQLKVSKDKSQ